MTRNVICDSGSSYGRSLGTWGYSASKPSIELQKVTETCKLLGCEQYSPEKFVGVLKETYAFLQQVNIYLTMHPTGYFLDQAGKDLENKLGKMLLTLDTETANETIGGYLDAGNATTL